MGDLEPWLTPMQAVVWIALRNPFLVHRASLDEQESREAAGQLADCDFLIGVRAGMSLLSLDIYLHYPIERAGESADMAVRRLISALRAGEVKASAEQFLSEAGARQSRAFMSPIDWADITLAEAPGDDRRLVTWRYGEISQFMTGRMLHDRWQSVMLNTDDLLARFRPLPLDRSPAEPDRAPDGHLFIDDAIATAMKTLQVSEGPATKRLHDAMHDGTVRTFQRSGGRGIQTVSRADWASAEIDLHLFRKEGHSGIRFKGASRHLHNVVIAADDFEGWLRVEADLREPYARARAERSAQLTSRPRAAPCSEDAVLAWLLAYMRRSKEQGSWGKREGSLKECMAACGCTYSEARAAWKNLPAELRRNSRQTDRAIRTF